MRCTIFALLVLVALPAFAQSPTRRIYADRNGTEVFRSYRASDGRETYYNYSGRKIGSSNEMSIGGVQRRTYTNSSGTRLGTTTTQSNGRQVYRSPLGRKVGSSIAK